MKSLWREMVSRFNTGLLKTKKMGIDESEKMDMSDLSGRFTSEKFRGQLRRSEMVLEDQTLIQRGGIFAAWTKDFPTFLRQVCRMCPEAVRIAQFDSTNRNLLPATLSEQRKQRDFVGRMSTTTQEMCDKQRVEVERTSSKHPTQMATGHWPANSFVKNVNLT
jgi:hypothetical protein